MATKTKAPIAESGELSIEQKIVALYNLQQIDSQIDAINRIKGELPLEVADLEDEVAGLQTRIQSLTEEIESLTQRTKSRKEDIENSKNLITKYAEQQKEVRNNREYDSLNKEVEYQQLEIELAEKHIKEFGVEVKTKKKIIDETKEVLDGRKLDLTAKQEELSTIEAETSKEIETLSLQAKAAAVGIDERLVDAYNRIRKNVRNGLAVVSVKRDACGGCFNRIPPQRQIEILQNKKLTICEYCGRILAAAEIDVVVE